MRARVARRCRLCQEGSDDWQHHLCVRCAALSARGLPLARAQAPPARRMRRQAVSAQGLQSCTLLVVAPSLCRVRQLIGAGLDEGRSLCGTGAQSKSEGRQSAVNLSFADPSESTSRPTNAAIGWPLSRQNTVTALATAGKRQIGGTADLRSAKGWMTGPADNGRSAVDLEGPDPVSRADIRAGRPDAPCWPVGSGDGTVCAHP